MAASTRIYDWNEIKAASDCRAWLREHGVKSTGQAKGEWERLAHPPWRPGSDSNGFTACRDAWKDHATGEHGSIIDLVAMAEYGNDIWQAQEALGKALGSSPVESPR